MKKVHCIIAYAMGVIRTACIPRPREMLTFSFERVSFVPSALGGEVILV